MTYSIVGADTRSREVGGAGASCLDGGDVYVIYGAAPGHGVVHAQASYSTDGRRRAAEMLALDRAPAEILASITAASFDRRAAVRQYGIIDVQGRSAAFTGAETIPFAGDRRGAADGYAYSVQGNILTSEKVLLQAATAFEAGGCDLAERLMSALEAGALDGQGDSRCTGRGIPSDSAFLQVERADGVVGDYLALRVESSGSQSPLPALRAQLDAWRADHPCPASADSSAGSAPAGCDCRAAAAPDGGALSGALVCSLLIVAWWRHRPAR